MSNLLKYRFKLYFYNQHMKTVPEMIEKAMPGLLYPVKFEEVDYFFTNYNTVAKVLSTEGNVIKMSDRNNLQVYDLRPINFTYLDTDIIDDEDVIATVANFSNDGQRYAHILQNRVRRKYSHCIERRSFTLRWNQIY